MGSSFARRLASEGYDLLLTDRLQEPLARLSAQLTESHPIRVSNVVADLGDRQDLHRLVQQVAELERLDLLINNAGFALRGDFWRRDLKRELEMIDVHISTCVSLTRAALPGMIARGRGDIINVSSVSAFMPVGGGDTYAATKAFIAIFSELLQIQLKGTGVHAMALCPGLTHTGFHDTPEWQDFKRSDVPRFLWGDPDEVVERALRALRKKKVICIPGFTNRVLSELGRNRLVRWLCRRLNTGQVGPRPAGDV
jgi:short-subunit dehydrogenase